MKASKETVNKMAELIKTYLSARFPLVLDKIKENKGNVSTADMWTIWHHICDEHRHDDDSPRFNNRKRVFPFNWDFELYPDGTNDKTLETALKKAFSIVAKS